MGVVSFSGAADSVSRQKELDIRVTAYPANAYNDELAQSPRW
jgi:hypothetical protein